MLATKVDHAGRKIGVKYIAYANGNGWGPAGIAYLRAVARRNSRLGATLRRSYAGSAELELAAVKGHRKRSQRRVEPGEMLPQLGLQAHQPRAAKSALEAQRRVVRVIETVGPVK